MPMTQKQQQVLDAWFNSGMKGLVLEKPEEVDTPNEIKEIQAKGVRNQSKEEKQKVNEFKKKFLVPARRRNEAKLDKWEKAWNVELDLLADVMWKCAADGIPGEWQARLARARCGGGLMVGD